MPVANGREFSDAERRALFELVRCLTTADLVPGRGSVARLTGESGRLAV